MYNANLRKALAVLLALILMLGAVPVFGAADNFLLPVPTRVAFVDLGDTNIDDGDIGDGWSFQNDVFYVSNGADITFSGSTTTRRILIEEGATAFVTLHDAEIVLNIAESPLLLRAGASLDLYVTGEKLKQPETAAAQASAVDRVSGPSSATAAKLQSPGA